MAGTRTVPTIAAGETGYLMSFSWIDDNEAEYTSSMLVKANVSDAELEAIIATAQLGSNASMFKAELTTQWEGAKNSDNALSVVHESVADKVRYSMKDVTTKAYVQAYLPAPIEALVGDNGIVDITQTVYINWKDDVDDVKPASFLPLNVAFVQYVQRNDSTSP